MYVAVKGGRKAIEAAHGLLAEARRGDPSLPEISPDQIRNQLALAVDRVQAEGSLYCPELAALAVKQAWGDLVEAVFLLRAARATLERFGYSEPVETSGMRPARRISGTFKDLPGGQILGPTFDYTHRLLNAVPLPDGTDGKAPPGSGAWAEGRPGADASGVPGREADSPCGRDREDVSPCGRDRGDVSPCGRDRGDVSPCGRDRGDVSPCGRDRGDVSPCGRDRGDVSAYDPDRGDVSAYDPDRGDGSPCGADRDGGSPSGRGRDGRDGTPFIPGAASFLERQGLMEREEETGKETPFDLTRTPLEIPQDRPGRLQALARADEGFLLALAYSSQRGYGSVHPFVADLRLGTVEVEFTAPETGFPVTVGEIELTECQTACQFKGGGGKPPMFTRGYGLTVGKNERKALSMSIVDRALRSRELGEAVKGPAQDEEFVLYHADNVEASGFVSHIKLPHYVDFQAELAMLRHMRSGAADGPEFGPDAEAGRGARAARGADAEQGASGEAGGGVAPGKAL